MKKRKKQKKGKNNLVLCFLINKILLVFVEVWLGYIIGK